jgi:hypothetical protein
MTVQQPDAAQVEQDALQKAERDVLGGGQLGRLHQARRA